MKHLEKTRLGLLYGATQLLSASGATPVRKRGTNNADTFDDLEADTNHDIRGYRGDDTYILANDTACDTVKEYHRDSGDKVKVKADVNKNNVRMRKDGRDLFIEILNDSGVAVDSLRVVGQYRNATAGIESVEFSRNIVWGDTELDADNVHLIRGFSDGGILIGRAGSVVDEYDTVAGNHTLKGGLGNDIYWLGVGTGKDTIMEPVSGGTDTIKLKANIASNSSNKVQLNRVNGDLYVEIVGSNGAIADYMRIAGQYSGSNIHGIESVVGSDGNEKWNLGALKAATIRGLEGGDVLYGTAESDTFDTDRGGDDILQGGGGSDTYFLGQKHSTEHDTIIESDVAGTDTIKIKDGIANDKVRLNRIVTDSGHSDLYVEILSDNGEVTDSLKVQGHYDEFIESSRKGIEKVELADSQKTTWEAADFDSAVIRGGYRTGLSQADALRGHEDNANTFRTEGDRNEYMEGYDGDDTYVLWGKTGHDTVYDYGISTGDKVKLEAGIADSQVQLRRDGDHLYVELLGSNGQPTDSLKIEDQYLDNETGIESVVRANGTVLWGKKDLDEAPIRGTASSETITGTDEDDFIDSNAGGVDILKGGSGSDTYLLGEDSGKGTNTIEESSDEDDNADSDAIKIKKGIAAGRVRLNRIVTDTGNDLYVEILGANDEVTSSLKVKGHYNRDSESTYKGIEKVILADETVLWDAKSAFNSAVIRGGYRRGLSEADALQGHDDNEDVFDTDGDHNEHLEGHDGNDTYVLSRKTGNDMVYDYGDDAGDKVQIKADVTSGNIRLKRDGDHLLVEILGSNGSPTDSLKMMYQYDDDRTGIESVVAADGDVIWTSAKIEALKAGQILIQDIAAFNSAGPTGGGSPTPPPDQNQANGLAEGGLVGS